MDMYQSILQDTLQPILLYQPSCHFDVDVLVNSLNSKLYQVSVAASSKLNTQTRKRKKKLPLWNDDIAAAVKRSKSAYREWKAAGSPRNPSNPYVQHRKEACTLMRRVIRRQVYLDKQDKHNQLMQVNDSYMKTFFRLVNQQRSTRSTATEMLLFKDKAHTSTEEVAEAFSQHFQK